MICVWHISCVATPALTVLNWWSFQHASASCCLPWNIKNHIDFENPLADFCHHCCCYEANSSSSLCVCCLTVSLLTFTDYMRTRKWCEHNSTMKQRLGDTEWVGHTHTHTHAQFSGFVDWHVLQWHQNINK